MKNVVGGSNHQLQQNSNTETILEPFMDESLPSVPPITSNPHAYFLEYNNPNSRTVLSIGYEISFSGKTLYSIWKCTRY